MAIIEIGALELAFGGIVGLVLLSIFNNAGAVICKVYFEPWLIKFKARHEKLFAEMTNGKDKGEKHL
jgi:hypothetical protein